MSFRKLLRMHKPEMMLKFLLVFVQKKNHYDAAWQNTNGLFQFKRQQSRGVVVKTMSPSTPLTTENMASVWYRETVESREDRKWGSF